MKPVYQNPMDGQCMRACICSIFEIPMKQGPTVQCEGHVWNEEEKQFICTIEEHRKVNKWTDGDGNPQERFYYECNSAVDQDKRINDWLGEFGLVMRSAYVDDGRWGDVGIRADSGGRGKLPAGLCIATGGSPRCSDNHAVVWDTRLIDFEHPMGRMVHDPTPDRENIGLKSLEHFYWFEVVDASKLVGLRKFKEEGE